ncbi:hypothetical protein NDU88_001345 [Pleurodeles waltl]|uniref:Uncharacterized protein n=1 Tax=Pleurodeles waltl TaxID=8319 RepID=A0AAV7THI6_PLEWA|nr:hypothetical protein NDU88_001345 [Pleurodeles waltl]
MRGVGDSDFHWSLHLGSARSAFEVFLPYRTPNGAGEILSQMASAVLNDHEYSSDLPSSESLPTLSAGLKDLSQSSDSQSDSDVSEPKPPGKRK